MTPFILGGILTWLAFVFGAGYAHARAKRKVNAAASLNISKAFEVQGENNKRILDAIGVVDKKFDAQAQNARLSQPKEATRVYASLLQRGFETRILVQPANTFDEWRAIVMREIGPDWMMLITAYTDVLGWKPQPSEPTAALVEKPIANFIHDLEYSRDHLADSPSQKAAVEEIITKLKQQHYGNSRSASAA